VGSGMGSQLGAARLLYGMGRSNAIPKSFFGAIESKRRIPRNNVLFVGVCAMLGTTFLTFERAAELLNFGALLAFMGVNAASFTRYFVRDRNRDLSNFLVPVLGFTVCFLLWINLSRPAKIAGVVWMVLGVAYGAVRTRGFKAELVSFDIPDEAGSAAEGVH
ncbi:MAG TPA: APC family permease, partial [Candidatus Polarisedimenticolia bacterium]|nr:APC family permease [Candidatus Polarisedimenticolia bacterium]